jgi:hypothetical protein
MPAFGAIIALMFARWVEVWYLVIWLRRACRQCPAPGHHLDALPQGRAIPCRAAQVGDAHDTRYLVFTIVWSGQGHSVGTGRRSEPHAPDAVLCCTLAGNGALVGASAPMSIVAYSVYGTAIVLMPFQTGGFIYWGLSGLAFFYALYMAWMSKQYFETTRSMLLLTNDKNDLIAALAQSKETVRHRALPRRSGKPCEIAVSRKHEPRAAYAAERDHRFLRVDPVPCVPQRCRTHIEYVALSMLQAITCWR